MFSRRISSSIFYAYLYAGTEGQLIPHFPPFEEEWDATCLASYRDKWEKCPDKAFDVKLDENIPETLSLPKRRGQNLGLGQGIDYRNGKVKATALKMAGV